MLFFLVIVKFILLSIYIEIIIVYKICGVVMSELYYCLYGEFVTCKYYQESINYKRSITYVTHALKVYYNTVQIYCL